MKYAVVKIVNGNFAINSEHGDNLDAAIMEWHNICRTIRGAEDVTTATIMIIDSVGHHIANYYEVIDRTERNTDS